MELSPHLKRILFLLTIADQAAKNVNQMSHENAGLFANTTFRSALTDSLMNDLTADFNKAVDLAVDLMHEVTKDG